MLELGHFFPSSPKPYFLVRPAKRTVEKPSAAQSNAFPLKPKKLITQKRRGEKKERALDDFATASCQI